MFLSGQNKDVFLVIFLLKYLFSSVLCCFVRRAVFFIFADFRIYFSIL